MGNGASLSVWFSALLSVFVSLFHPLLSLSPPCLSISFSFPPAECLGDTRLFQVLCRVVSSGMITDKRWLFDHFVADYSRFLEHHVVHIRKVGAASRAFQVAGRIVAAARERGGMAFACAAALQKHKTNTLDGGGGCGE